MFFHLFLLFAKKQTKGERFGQSDGTFSDFELDVASPRRPRSIADSSRIAGQTAGQHGQ